ncbi:MAG: CotH kinase family protein [bacterium]
MYLKKIIVFVLFLFNSFPFIMAQTNDESRKLYDDTKLGRIDVTVSPEALIFMYQNIHSDSEHVATIRFRNKYIDETIDSVGFRLRGNTSRDAQKKSFKISFNSFVKGRDFYGVEKLNLNGEHNDPSIIRSKICFDLFNKAGVIASRAAHIEVYINGNYFGLYISVEHIDEEFIKKNFTDDSGNLWKCLYPADLKYIGSDPNLYKNLNNNGVPVYELSTNEDIGDFSKLVNFIKIINQTPPSTFEDSLETVLDVASVLKYFAWNVLFGSWDSYWTLSNNYYLYNNPATNKFSLIPYDYDNTFGIEWWDYNWSSVNPYSLPTVAGGNTPLAEKMMQNSQYKNLYTHFLEFYSNNLFKLNLWENHLDSLKQMITNAAIADSFRTLDYGFTVNDFNNSYSVNNYSKYHVKFGLKQYVNLRNSNLVSQLNYISAKPIAYQIEYSPKNPKGTDSIYIYVSAFSKIGFTNTSIKINLLDSGTETTYPLNYSPVPNTKKVEEYDRYVCVIPPLGDGKKAEFYVSLTNTAGQSQNYPRNGKITITTQINNNNSVVLNEFLADNVNSFTDPSGEHDDWVELYNNGNEPVLLSGKFLTDNLQRPEIG